jgi:hypothetical protein
LALELNYVGVARVIEKGLDIIYLEEKIWDTVLVTYPQACSLGEFYTAG